MTAAGKVFGFAAIACGCLVLLGSWAPLNFHGTTLDEVWDRYLAAGSGRRTSRSDIAANILLGIPFAYTLLGFLTTDHRIGNRRIVATLLTMVAAAFLALLVELGQGWIPSRTPSIRDSIAQIFGAAIGCSAWWLTGDRAIRLSSRMPVGDRTHARVQAATTIVALCVLLLSLLPGDVLVSPVDLARKWTKGDIELIPFSQSHTSIGESIFRWIAAACLAVPLGLWASQFWTFYLRRTKTLTEKAWMALALGLVPEILQVPIAGRIASATDALFGVIGAAVGISLGEMLWDERKGVVPTTIPKPTRQPAFWFLMTIVFLGIVCWLSWYPFNFASDPDIIRGRLRDVVSTPFSVSQGSNWSILFAFAGLAVTSVILGGLAGIGTGLIQSRVARSAAAVGIALATFPVSLGLEFGQLLETTHTGGGLGFMFRVMATLSGFALGYYACRGGGLIAQKR